MKYLLSATLALSLLGGTAMASDYDRDDHSYNSGYGYHHSDRYDRDNDGWRRHRHHYYRHHSYNNDGYRHTDRDYDSDRDHDRDHDRY